jgi:hypothetical protein
MLVRLTPLLLAAASMFLISGVTGGESVVDDWKLDLDRANALLSKGKYNDAIALYDNVIRTSFLLKV